MVVSQLSIQQRAYRLAVSQGLDPHGSGAVDTQFAFENNFPHALRRAATELAGRDESEAANLKRTYALTLSSGVATLPVSVIQECLDRSMIYSDSDSTVAENSSYQPRYSDYIRPAHSQLGYYSINGTSFCYRAPYGAANSFSGNLKLVTAGMPDIPGSLTTAMTISDRLAERTVELLADMVRGGNE